MLLRQLGIVRKWGSAHGALYGIAQFVDVIHLAAAAIGPQAHNTLVSDVILVSISPHSQLPFPVFFHDAEIGNIKVRFVKLDMILYPSTGFQQPAVHLCRGQVCLLTRVAAFRWYVVLLETSTTPLCEKTFTTYCRNAAACRGGAEPLRPEF